MVEFLDRPDVFTIFMIVCGILNILFGRFYFTELERAAQKNKILYYLGVLFLSIGVLYGVCQDVYPLDQIKNIWSEENE